MIRIKKNAKFEITRTEVTAAMMKAGLRGIMEITLRMNGYPKSMKVDNSMPQSNDTCRHTYPIKVKGCSA